MVKFLMPEHCLLKIDNSHSSRKKKVKDGAETGFQEELLMRKLR